MGAPVRAEPARREPPGTRRRETEDGSIEDLGGGGRARIQLPRGPVEDAAQLGRQLSGGGVAQLRVLRQSALEDALKAGREACELRRDVGERRVDDPVDDLGHVGPLEGPAAGEHLEQHDPQGEDVRPSGDLAAQELLRRHVTRCAEDLVALVAERDLVQTRDAEVGELHLARLVEEDVGGLDVPVDDAHGVEIVERRGDLGHQVDGALEVELAAGRQDLGQAAAAHVLHGHEDRPVGPLDQVIDRDDVRVGEHAGAARLAEQVVPQRAHPVALRFLPRRPGGPEALDRHLAADQAVARQVDRPRGPAADLPYELVTSEVECGVQGETFSAAHTETPSKIGSTFRRYWSCAERCRFSSRRISRRRVVPPGKLPSRTCEIAGCPGRATRIRRVAGPAGTL